MKLGNIPQHTAASVLAVPQGLVQATVYNVTDYAYQAFYAVFCLHSGRAPFSPAIHRRSRDTMKELWRSLNSPSTDFLVCLCNNSVSELHVQTQDLADC